MTARSAPIVVRGPCPGNTIASSGLVRSLVAIDSMICGVDPPGRSVRPIDPANSVSPVNSSSVGFPGPAGTRYTTAPPVWPGTWSTNKCKSGERQILAVAPASERRVVGARSGRRRVRAAH